MKKRITADKPKNGPVKPFMVTSDATPNKGPSGNSVKVILNNVMKDCEMKDIKPCCCIPLYLLRGKSLPAVRKLVSIFEGKAAVNNSITGLFSGKPSSVVVPLVRELEKLVIDYFISEGFSEEDSIEIKSQHEVWYGIIDGCQFHAAVTELIKKSQNKWSTFMWKVIVVKPNKDMAEYRQLARLENEKNKAFYIHESTIYDLLRGLRIEYDELYRKALKSSRTGVRGAKVNYKLVAEQYDGGVHTTNTYIRQAASVAVRLSQRTIDAIGQVCNEDCAELILCDKEMNKSDMKTVDDVHSQTDSRLFKSFVCFGALRGAKAFMNAVWMTKKKLKLIQYFV